MKYDLKETKTSDKETLEHCLTVIHCILDGIGSYSITEQERAWKRAKRYLKDYIKELFKQNEK